MAKKKKGSNPAKVPLVLLPIISVLMILVIVATIVMNMYDSVVSQVLGYGEMVVSGADNSDLDGEYYIYEAGSTDESLEYAQETTQEIVSEGTVLLQNNESLPLQSGAKVTLLGYYALHPNMSGGEDPRETEGAYCFDDGFEKAGMQVNPDTIKFYEGMTTEPTIDQYTSELEAHYNEYSDAAVVVIKRNSGEGSDQARSVAEDNGRTGMSISSTELDLLEYACGHFDNVIVIINSSNAMELGFTEGGSYTDKYTGKTYDFKNLKAALWVGGCGSQGPVAVGQILQGEVNPSGHLVDTYVRDLTKDPTYNNFGDYAYTNAADAGSYADESYFVEYEEGIYFGYKYYETAAYEASQGNYEGFDYDTEVVYPFGYGLSYTSFDMEYASTPEFDSETNEYTFEVNITNTGDAAGKGVAQVYVNAPYKEGGIEKSHVLLAGYAKSGILEPGAAETVTISVNRDYITSYDYKVNKCYVWEAGDYNFYLMSDAHDWVNIDNSDEKHCWTESTAADIVYNEDNKRASDETAAVNAFDDELNWKFTNAEESSEGYCTDFSRADFKGSFPTAPVGNDYVADEYTLATLKKYDPTAESEQTAEEYPTTDSTETSLQLADMRGVDYNDELWDTYMNQFSVDSMYNMFRNGGWVEQGDAVNGVPESYDLDGPYGFFSHANPPENTNKWYQAAPVLAATYNTELARKMGDSIAEEAQTQSVNGKIFTGWYGPGANTHRSAFGGRNYEYFSEDAILSGTMAAEECSAASEKGLITFLKHYVLNDQETNRQNNGYCCWVNEQALREGYIRGFEIYAKEATMTVNYYADEDDDGTMELTSKEMPAATGIMTAYNRVGAVWAGASDAVSVVLRQECGFVGTSLTDAGGGADHYMNTDLGIRTGGTDLMLATNTTLTDSQSPTAVTAIRNAAKTILYNKANSNCMIGLVPGGEISYTTATWKIVMNVLCVFMVLLTIGDAVWFVKAKKKMKKPAESAVVIEK